MKNDYTNKFNKTLLSELGVLIIILFLIAILINCYSIYHGSSYRFQERQQETAESILLDLNSSFEGNYNEDTGTPFKWFVDFWHAHYEDMNLSAYTFDELWVNALAICSQYDCYMPTSLKPEVIEGLSYEDQLILARYQYVIDNANYNKDWSYEGMDVAGYVLRAFILEDDDKGFVIFKSDPDYSRGLPDNNAEPEFFLGETIHFDLNQHHYARKALATTEFQRIPERDFS